MWMPCYSYIIRFLVVFFLSREVAIIEWAMRMNRTGEKWGTTLLRNRKGKYTGKTIFLKNWKKRKKKNKRRKEKKKRERKRLLFSFCFFWAARFGWYPSVFRSPMYCIACARWISSPSNIYKWLFILFSLVFGFSFSEMLLESCNGVSWKLIFETLKSLLKSYRLDFCFTISFCYGNKLEKIVITTWCILICYC